MDAERRAVIALGFLDGLIIGLGLDTPARRERRERRNRLLYGTEPATEPVEETILRDYERVLGDPSSARSSTPDDAPGARR